MNEVDQKQLGQVFAQSQSNSEEIKNLRTDLNSFAASIRASIENLGDRLNRAGRTDWQAVGIWAGVVFAVITPVLYFQHEQVTAMERRADHRTERLERIYDEQVKADIEELRALKAEARKRLNP